MMSGLDLLNPPPTSFKQCNRYYKWILTGKSTILPPCSWTSSHVGFTDQQGDRKDMGSVCIRIESACVTLGAIKPERRHPSQLERSFMSQQLRNVTWWKALISPETVSPNDILEPCHIHTCCAGKCSYALLTD